MRILDADVAKFRDLYRTKLGIELDARAAYAKLFLLVTQVKHTYKPITQEQLRAYLAHEDEHEPKRPKTL